MSSSKITTMVGTKQIYKSSKTIKSINKIATKHQIISNASKILDHAEITLALHPEAESRASIHTIAHEEVSPARQASSKSAKKSKKSKKSQNQNTITQKQAILQAQAQLNYENATCCPTCHQKQLPPHILENLQNNEHLITDDESSYEHEFEDFDQQQMLAEHAHQYDDEHLNYDHFDPLDDLLAYKQHIHVKAANSNNLTQSLLKVLADETRTQGRTIYKVELDDLDPELKHRNFEKFFRVCPEDEMYIRLGVTDSRIEAGILHPQATKKWFIDTPELFYTGFMDDISKSIISLIQPFHANMKVSEIPQKQEDIDAKMVASGADLAQYEKLKHMQENNFLTPEMADQQMGFQVDLDQDGCCIGHEDDEIIHLDQPDHHDGCSHQPENAENRDHERRLQIEKEVLRQVYENFTAMEDVSRRRDIKYRLHKKQIQRKEEAILQAKRLKEMENNPILLENLKHARDQQIQERLKYEEKTVDELLEMVGGETKKKTKSRGKKNKKKRNTNSNSNSAEKISTEKISAGKRPIDTTFKAPKTPSKNERKLSKNSRSSSEDKENKNETKPLKQQSAEKDKSKRVPQTDVTSHKIKPRSSKHSTSSSIDDEEHKRNVIEKASAHLSNSFLENVFLPKKLNDNDLKHNTSIDSEVEAFKKLCVNTERNRNRKVAILWN